MLKFDKIIGIYNKNHHKIINIFGFKIKLKNSNQELHELYKKMDKLHNDLNRNMQKNISVCVQHNKAFSGYKNAMYGKDVFLIATGPTLNYFNSVADGVYVGCNVAFKYEKVKLDYLFMQDYEAVRDYIDDVVNFVSPECKLFYGYTCEFKENRSKIIPESIAIKHGAMRYYTDWAAIKGFKPEFVCDITTQPLCCYGTVAFPAMQFNLWTNPKRIYLVGCDCSSSHYDKSKLGDNLDDLTHLIKKWVKLKNFAQAYYPDTEIISVNPVGLRGVFKEVWTEAYLAEHPEIRDELGENIEILKTKEVMNV